MLVLWIVGLALGLGGCGSSSGSADTSANASLLAGTHFLWVFSATDDVPDRGNAAWAVVTLDGVSAMTGTAGENAGGSVIGPLPLAATYGVAADRSTTFSFGAGSNYSGWSNVDGSAALAGATAASSTPAAIGLLKLTSGVVDADLAGNWFLGAVVLTVTGSISTYWGSATLDAVGAGTATISANFEGVVAGGPPVALSAATASNGQLTMTMGGTPLEGAMHVGRNLIVAVGSTTDTEDPTWVVLVRKTSGASNATFGGTYQIVGLERDGGGFGSLTGAVVANGAGSLTATFTKNTDGVISASGPDVVSYAAAADGGLIVDAVGEPLEGGFSAGGAFAVLAGPTTAMTNPRIYVLLRR